MINVGEKEMMSRWEKYKQSYQAYRRNYQDEIRKTRKIWEQRNPNYYTEYRRQHPEVIRRGYYKWRKQNMKIIRVYRRMKKHREEYPLEDECIFCGRSSNLEHAHLDYEDKGHNYVTTCHQCNHWMEKKR